MGIGDRIEKESGTAVWLSRKTIGPAAQRANPHYAPPTYPWAESLKLLGDLVGIHANLVFRQLRLTYVERLVPEREAQRLGKVGFGIV